MKEIYNLWNPFEGGEKITKDPYKTLFIGHLSTKVTEKKLRKEFEIFGPIENMRIVTDHKQNSMGYAFIEFEN